MAQALALRLATTALIFRHGALGFTALLAVALVAFWPSYFATLPAADRYTHLHAGAMLAWCGLLIGQARLIRRDQRAWHRIWGLTSYALVPVILASFILLAHHRLVTDPAGLTPSRSALLFIQFGAAALFGWSYALAMANRHVPALHARYMVCTAFTLIDPAVARIFFAYLPGVPFGADLAGAIIVDGLLIALIARERHERTGRGAFPVMLGLFLLAQIGPWTVATTQMWKDMAVWFGALPLT